jgi:hypothetical protein
MRLFTMVRKIGNISMMIVDHQIIVKDDVYDY